MAESVSIEEKTPAKQYSTIEKAEGYKKYFNSCALEFELIQKPSIVGLIGKSLKDKEVIDYACGNGESTKFLSDLNPSKLVGVDVSQTMIDLAIKECSSHPTYSKIDYHVRDCSQPVGLGQFDLVFSRHLLNYPQTKEILFGMIKSMFESTKPGGVCAGLMVNPHAIELNNFEKYYKYNLEFTRINETEVYVRMFDGHAKNAESKFLRDLHEWFWTPKVYEEFFLKAGFDRFEWVELRLDESAAPEHQEFYKDFFNPSIFTLFKATRPLN